MSVDDRSLTDIRQALINARDDGEESFWKQGALIVQAIAARARELPSKLPKKERRLARKQLLSDLASDLGCSPSRIYQLAEVYVALGEVRNRLKLFAWHRAVLMAAKRTKQMPLTMLDEAVQENLSTPELNRLGVQPKPGHGAAFRGRCPLGHVVQYVADGEAGSAYRGTAISCGLCAGHARRNGEPETIAAVIGQME
jgi:hypothetical protein